MIDKFYFLSKKNKKLKIMQHLKTKDSTIEISNTGATIISWKINEEEVLFPQQYLLINGISRLRGGIPICFPNFGKARKYNDSLFEQHGFLRKTDLYVEEVSPSGIKYWNTVWSAGLGYKVNVFIDLHDQVYNGSETVYSLTQSIKVCSASEQRRPRMPLCLAFHPYFKFDRNFFKMEKDQRGVVSELTINGGLTKEKDPFLLESCMHYFTDYFEIQVGKNRSVTIKGDNDFKTGLQRVFIWSDEPNKYICAEPVMHNPNLFGTDEGYFLGKKEKMFTVTYQYHIKNTE